MLQKFFSGLERILLSTIILTGGCRTNSPKIEIPQTMPSLQTAVKEQGNPHRRCYEIDADSLLLPQVPSQYVIKEKKIYPTSQPAKQFSGYYSGSMVDYFDNNPKIDRAEIIFSKKNGDKEENFLLQIWPYYSNLAELNYSQFNFFAKKEWGGYTNYKNYPVSGIEVTEVETTEKRYPNRKDMRERIWKWTNGNVLYSLSTRLATQPPAASQPSATQSIKSATTQTSTSQPLEPAEDLIKGIIESGKIIPDELNPYPPSGIFLCY